MTVYSLLVDLSLASLLIFIGMIIRSKVKVVQRGFVPASLLAGGTISTIALDPVAFHLALLLIPSGLGYLLNKFIEKTWGLDLPSFTVAFLLSLVMFMVLGKGKKGVYKYVDSRIVSRLGSTATDYLVFFGIAAIKLPVIRNSSFDI